MRDEGAGVLSLVIVAVPSFVGQGGGQGGGQGRVQLWLGCPCPVKNGHEWKE